MSKRPKIGLALGPGGARGLAHIGVLKVLERKGIPIDIIVGTSIGALVGAAYAVNPDATALEKRVSDFLGAKKTQNRGLRLLGRVHRNDCSKSDLLHRIFRIAQKQIFLGLVMLRNALVSEKDIQACIEAFLPNIALEDTAIPYAAIAVDLVSGRQEILKQGPLVTAVMASCAVPGFIPAVSWDGMILVDGGVIESIPAAAAKARGAEAVIGVDVGSSLCGSCNIEDGIDAINRAAAIMSYRLNRQSSASTDVLIEPDVKQFEWTDFPKYEELIMEGEVAAESKIDEIRETLQHRFGKNALQQTREFFEGLKKRFVVKVQTAG